MRYVYSILFWYEGMPENQLRKSGKFLVYSDEEIQEDRLSQIVDEVKSELPEALALEPFEDHVYAALERRGLKRNDDVNHGSIGFIEYHTRMLV